MYNFLKVFRQSYKAQLIQICLLTILTFPVVSFSSAAIPRAVFAFPLIFFFPGYVLLIALFPRKEDLNGIERLLLSFALSMAIETLILLALNFTWSLALYPSLISITIFIIIISYIAWWQLSKIQGKNLNIPNQLSESIAFSPPTPISPRIKVYRFGLWALLIILSAAILFFPMHITLDPTSIQSLNIFENLPLFISLFLIWMAILLILLFYKKIGGRNDWVRLALVCIFTLVFLSYWTILTPNSVGGDSLANLGTVKYLQLEGGITNSSVRYFDFPGVFLFTNFLSLLTGLDIIATGYIIVIISTILFCALIYLFFTRVLKSTYAAAAAILLASIGGQIIRTEFRPDSLGHIFLATILVLLTRNEREPLKSKQERIIAIILILAATITYLMHSGLILFIMFGIFLVQKLAKERTLSILLILVSLIALVSWELYSAESQFDTTVGFIPSILKHLGTGNFLFTAGQTQTAAAGPGVPSWAIAVRYFWLAAFYGFGTILGFIALAKFRRLDPLERIAAGGFLGVGVVSVFLLILWPSGHQFTRYLWYSPIFLAPIIIKFCFRQRWQKYIIVLFTVLLFTLSLPSFLIHGSSISSAYVSSEEMAAGEFLNSQYGEGDGVTVYSNYFQGGDIAWYYTLHAVCIGTQEYSELKDGNALFSNIDGLVKEFQKSGNNSIFVYSERRALGWDGIFGLKIDDPRWQQIKATLGGENGENIIFSNGYIHIYSPPIHIK